MQECLKTWDGCHDWEIINGKYRCRACGKEIIKKDDE